MQYSVVIVALSLVMLMLSGSTASALALSCPLSNPQEATPYERRLCYAIEQAINENGGSMDQYRKLVERNVNDKRQDVDHVFLRFGKRFLL